MADSFLGDISSQIGGIAGSAGSTLTPEVASAVASVMADPAFAQTLQHMAEGLHVDLAPLVGGIQAAGETIDATPATGHGDGAATPPVTMDAITTHLQTMIENAQAKLESGDKETQAQGQLDMQHATDAMTTILQHMQEEQSQALQNLRGDSGGDPDAPLVAMADHGDGHVVTQGDHDAGTAHQADQPVTTHPHEDTTSSDPSAA